MKMLPVLPIVVKRKVGLQVVESALALAVQKGSNDKRSWAYRAVYQLNFKKKKFQVDEGIVVKSLIGCQTNSLEPGPLKFTWLLYGQLVLHAQRTGSGVEESHPENSSIQK